MTGHHTENPRGAERTQGNLGQNKAEQEKTSDEKLEHMGDDGQSDDKTKERKDQSGKRAG